MKVSPWLLLGILLGALVIGCAPPGAGVSAGAASPTQPSRVLVIIARFEPTSLSLKEVPAGQSNAGLNGYFNAGLTYVGDQDTAYPYLATDLPRLNTDTWTLLSDGRMETIYRLKSGVVWQDGVPLSAEDFAFSARVYATPEFGYSKSAPNDSIEEVLARDPATVVIRWRRPYPDADRISASGLPPLPRHILQSAFDRNAEGLGNHPYWTAEYVGLGPWRLDHWEPGAFVEGVAFDGHILGRPKIDRIRQIANGDSNAVLATLLAGEAQLSLQFAIYPEQAAVLKQQRWEGTVLGVPLGWRKIDIQFRPDFVKPRAILDVRVRKAFAHAIDRDAINEAVYLGESIITDTSVDPSASYWTELQPLLARYPYDLRRVDQLMAEAGFAKGSDSGYTSPTEGRLSVEIKANNTEALVKESAIIASYWRQAGFETTEMAVPAAQATSSQFRGSFPAFYTGQGGNFPSYITIQIGRPENNWVGNNRGGFSHPEFDRLYEIFATNLERAERDRAAMEMSRIQSEEVASISLLFQVNTIAVAKGLSGPAPWGPGGSLTTNMHLWEWR